MHEMLYLQVAAGLRGNAATVDVGTTTTLAEGQSATVTNSGDTHDAELNFGVPRGAIPAVGFNFDTSTADADPGDGDVRFNNATPASVTAIYFDNKDRDGNDVTAWLDSFDDADHSIRGKLTVIAAATPYLKLTFNVTGSVVDGTGYRKVTVAHLSGATLPASGAHLGFSFAGSADDGSDGEMTGPGVSVDGEAAVYDGADGTTLKRFAATGMVKATAGVLAQAVAGTDYYNPGGTDVAIADGGTGQSTAALAFAALKQDATTSATGVVELATTAETVTGTDTTRAVTPSGIAGAQIFPGLPQNSKSAAYTVVLGDANKHIFHPAADTTARIFTIDSNANVAFPIGTTLTFVNEGSAGVITIAITSDTLVLTGTGTTGSRTLAAHGMATAIKVTSTKWYISGAGLT